MEKAKRSHLLIVGLLPCALVALANAELILDHFYARPPYLLDAGWLSAVIHRSGVMLRNPAAMIHYGDTFYSVHVSPFMSLFSLLSYVIPVDRIEWYAFFQAIVYAPLGLATHLVSSRSGAVPAWRLPLTALLALAFAFSGQTLVAMEYPHFEPAIPGFLCLLLASVVTGRTILVWPLLALTLSVREDAGIHAGLALCPLLYLTWRKEIDVYPRRGLVALICTAFGVSALGFAAKSFVFHTKGLNLPFFGDPMFHHLSAAALWQRVTWLVRDCPFISVPLLATALIAAARRDPRYLLGWLAATPWLVANMLSFEDAKWRFGAYSGFPFLASLFWVYLYGALLAPPVERMKRGTLELVFGVTCLASIGALYLSRPWLVQGVVRGMLRSETAHPNEVRAYANAIRDRGQSLGRLSVDGPVAAVAIETLVRGDGFEPGRVEVDTFAFHRDGPLDSFPLVELAAAGIPRCTHVLETGFVLCSKYEGASARALAAVPTRELPALLVYAQLDPSGRRIAFEPGGVVIGAGSAPGLTIATRELAKLNAGSYEIVWDLEIGEGAEVSLDLVIDGVERPKVTVSKSEQVVLPFTVRALQHFGTRLWYGGPGSVTIKGAQLRAAAKP